MPNVQNEAKNRNANWKITVSFEKLFNKNEKRINTHNDSCYDVAQICVNGHVINRTVFFFAKGVIEVKIVF